VGQSLHPKAILSFNLLIHDRNTWHYLVVINRGLRKKRAIGLKLVFIVKGKHAIYVRLNVTQESRAVARKPRDAVAVLSGLKFADNVHSAYSLQV